MTWQVCIAQTMVADLGHGEVLVHIARPRNQNRAGNNPRKDFSFVCSYWQVWKFMSSKLILQTSEFNVYTNLK